MGEENTLDMQMQITSVRQITSSTSVKYHNVLKHIVMVEIFWNCLKAFDVFEFNNFSFNGTIKVALKSYEMSAKYILPSFTHLLILHAQYEVKLDWKKMGMILKWRKKHQ